MNQIRVLEMKLNKVCSPVKNDSEKKPVKNAEPLPKLAERCAKMSKSSLSDRLCEISERIEKIVSDKYKDSKIKNVNEEAYDYDKLFFEETGFNSCLLDSNKVKKCYCAKCIMNEDLSLDMIANKSRYLKTLKGKRVLPVCRGLYDPVIVKRGKEYYLLVRSEVKGFNNFLPIVDVLNNF